MVDLVLQSVALCKSATAAVLPGEPDIPLAPSVSLLLNTTHMPSALVSMQGRPALGNFMWFGNDVDCIVDLHQPIKQMVKEEQAQAVVLVFEVELINTRPHAVPTASGDTDPESMDVLILQLASKVTGLKTWSVGVVKNPDGSLNHLMDKESLDNSVMNDLIGESPLERLF